MVDLLTDITTPEAWTKRRGELRNGFLELIRDGAKPKRPSLDLQIEETVRIDDAYERLSITYQVEADERAHAYLGLPLKDGSTKLPAVVALHGTTAEGTLQTAGLGGDPDKAFLDQLCRRGFAVIAPEHFVSGRRIPPEGPYETGRFYRKHPEWTAVGKFTFEHSIAIDVLEAFDRVDPSRIGCMGHSLGGHGTYFLAAYDARIRAAVCNCGGANFRANPEVMSFARDHWYVYFGHLRETLLAGKLPPIDIHEIIALIAPRAYLDIFGLNDGNKEVQHRRTDLLNRVSNIYELLGQPENFAYFAHAGGHSYKPESRSLAEAFLATHLCQETEESV